MNPPDLLVVRAYLARPESPAEHARNALAVLKCLERADPVLWASAPELGRAVRRAHAAVNLLESGAPPQTAVPHLEAAVRALADAPELWDLSEDVGAACERLIRAYFGALGGGWR